MIDHPVSLCCVAAAELLGVDQGQLEHALITRTRQTPEGPIVSPLDVKTATENRDSLAKIIYSKVGREKGWQRKRTATGWSHLWSIVSTNGKDDDNSLSHHLSSLLMSSSN